MADVNSTLQNDFNIRVSKILVDEFYSRNIFPELRHGMAKRITGPSHLFIISIKLADEIFNYADDLYRSGNINKGIKTALSALRRQLESSIKEYKVKGLIKDPGFGEARRLMSDSSAVFSIGDYCLYRQSNGKLVEVEITCGYDLYRVSRDQGKFYDEDDRFDYLYGYVVKRLGGNEFYSPPHQLLDRDFNIKHIRLVAGKHSFSASGQ